MATNKTYVSKANTNADFHNEDYVTVNVPLLPQSRPLDVYIGHAPVSGVRANPDVWPPLSGTW